MSNEVAVPDYLKAMMADGQVQDVTSTMQSGAGSVPRLTTKGKTFRFKLDDDEQKAGQEVKLVIVGLSPIAGLAHTFYKDGYTPDASSPPDCSSNDGVKPDPWISNPQNDVCASCPNQKWGSAVSMSGGKAKACRDSRHLYVAKAKEFGENPAEATLYLLQVTVNSLKNFSNYGKELAAAGIPGPQFVVTQVTMDEEASVPMLHFKMLGVLAEKLGIASHTRSEAKEWSSATALPPPSGKPAGKQELPESPAAIEAPSEPIEGVAANLDDDEDVNSLIEDW
jgi:hypothetical protein